jgi:hypothetical protein
MLLLLLLLLLPPTALNEGHIDTKSDRCRPPTAY